MRNLILLITVILLISCSQANAFLFGTPVKTVKNLTFNGSQSQKLPGVISVSFQGFNSDILLIKLDREKIYVSNGSACGSGLVKPSHVLEAIGLDESTNLSTLRFSFGISNNSEEIETLVHILKNKILK